MEMHLFYFDSDVLSRLFRNAGFEVLCVEPYRRYASIRYAFRKFCAFLPDWIRRPLGAVWGIMPELIIPVSFSDVKLFVGRKASP